MIAIKSNMSPNKWYRAYRKQDAKLVTVKFLGMTAEGVRFADRDQHTYAPNDFYFWREASQAK